MRRDKWTEETVPSRRVRPDSEVEEEYTRPSLATVPVFVWVLGFVVVLLVLSVCGLWALYLLRGQVASSGPTPTPIIWTPTANPTPLVGPTLAPTEMNEPTPTASSGIAIGRYVRVTGTGGYGLSLRSGPGEETTRVDVALDGEVLLVVEGPTVAGGSEWWKIRDPENEAREWWAIGNFLEPVEHP